MPSLCQKTWTKCSFLCPSVAKNTGSTDSIGSKTWNTVITSDLQRSLKQLKRQKQCLDEPNNSHQKLRAGSMVSRGNKMNWHRKERGQKITTAMEHKESCPSPSPLLPSYLQEDSPKWASSAKGSFLFWGQAQSMTAAPPKTRLPSLIFIYFPGGRSWQKGSKSVQGEGKKSEWVRTDSRSSFCGDMVCY